MDNKNGLKILELIKNSSITQKVYFKEELYYLSIVNIPGNMKYNLSLTNDKPLSTYYQLSFHELDEVYSEEVWKQILRDRKINNLLDNASSV
jgi:hypothetical protein